MTTVLDSALAYLRAGCSVIPIRADGSKQPVESWKQWQTRLPSEWDIARWFNSDEPVGIAVVAGAVSGNLLVLDFDSYPAFCDFEQKALEQELTPLLRRLPCAATPSGGRHFYLRTPEPMPTTVLARDENGEVLVETRGEGAYAIAPPSPAEVHPAGKPYEWLQHDLTTTPTLTAEELEDLLSLARSLNRRPDPAPVPELRTKGESDAQRVGDRYNGDGDVVGLLQRHGWRVDRRNGEWVHLTRPGKQRGVSASWHEQERFFHVFTTNVPPFEAGRSYSPFAVYALLEHGGDYSAAARALADSYGLTGRDGGRAQQAAPMPELAQPRRAISVGELLAKEFKPLQHLVPGVLPEGGLVLFVGKAKTGKSWFCLQLACALSSGTFAFGLDERLPKKRVLYCALEDGLRRLQTRIRLLGIQPDPEGLQIVTELSPLDKGGLEELRQLIRDTQAEVVVIDVMTRILPQRKRNDDAYSHDYRTFATLKTLADTEGVTIIGVLHARKGDASDVVDTAQGTTGVTGAADSFLILRRGRAESTATLYVGGRDVENEGALALSFVGGRWYIDGDAKEVEMSEARQEILSLLRNSTEPLSPREIANELEKNYHTTRTLLRRMLASGDVQKDGRGRYSLAKGQAKSDYSESRTHRTQRNQSTIEYDDDSEYGDDAEYADYADYDDYTHTTPTSYTSDEKSNREKEKGECSSVSGSDATDDEEDINWGG